MKPPLTPERLRELLHYSPETGLFVHKVARGRRAVGSVAGTTSNGYIIVWIDNASYRAHRLAWFYVTGAWPTHEIDHIDGDRTNNRFLNLRDVTRSVNRENLKRSYKSNALGVLGVFPHGRRYVASIRVRKKQIYLGTYATPELAHAAYLAAKRTMHVGSTL